VRKLKNIDVEEISLVDVPANRKKFYFLKRSQTMEELLEILKGMFGDDVLTAEEIEKAKEKELSEEASKAIKGALNILNKYKDDMPPDVKDAIKVLAKYASYGYPAKKSAGDVDLEKVGARLSKATVEDLQRAIDILQKVIDKEKKEEGKEKTEKGLESVSKALEDLKGEFESTKTDFTKKLETKDAEITQLRKELEEAKKIKGEKTSLDGQDDKDVQKSGKKKWPSLLKKE